MIEDQQRAISGIHNYVLNEENKFISENNDLLKDTSHEQRDLEIRNLTVDVIIPTYRSDEKFEKLLEMLYQQTLIPNKVIVLHTMEYEGQVQTIPEISNSNIVVIPINKNEFDHGGTRKLGASFSDADIILMMTQDSVPVDEYLIENLMKPYKDPKIAATYARQLPNEKADLSERYTRHFNYPKISKVKSKDDLEELGIKTFFCSNVCASYRNNVYKELGGFVDKTIFNEDMIMSFSMIQAGYSVAYNAEAKVVHSHKYSYIQQFTRNFDLGVSHNEYAHVFGSVKSESEGIKLVKTTLQYLIKKKAYHLIPDLVINSGFKFLGYQLGKRYDLLPKNLVVQFSMNKGYWK